MIKVFTGPMFASKSEKLIEIAQKTEKHVLAFKPSKDTRDNTKIRSRALKETIEAKVISDLNDIHKHLDCFLEEPENFAIFIDEAQFLTGDVAILANYSLLGFDFYIAGLSMTSELKPFGIMPNILAIADEIVHLKAVCANCNDEAIYTYYSKPKSTDIIIGNKGYKPLCAHCFNKMQEAKRNHRALIVSQLNQLKEEIRMNMIYCHNCSGDCFECSRYGALCEATKIISGDDNYEEG